MTRKIYDWLLIMLIVLFFAIPVCSLVIADHITAWPKYRTNFLYNLICR